MCLLFFFMTMYTVTQPYLFRQNFAWSISYKFFWLHNLLSQSQMETKGVLTEQEFAVSISPVGSFTITITYAPY